VAGILVAGGSGLLGRAVLAEARRSEAEKVHSLVRRPPGDIPADTYVAPLVRETVEVVASLIARLDPEAIVNCVGRTDGDEVELVRANFDTVNVLLDAMERSGSAARVVHIGSAAEYAPMPDERPTTEQTPLVPSTPYGAAKAAASRLVLRARGERAIDAIVARVFNPLGAGMPPTSLAGRAARLVAEAARSGRAWVEFGPLDARRDFIDVRDVARAVVLLARSQAPEHDTYNIGRGVAVPVRELVHLISDRVGFAGEIREGAEGSPRSAALVYQRAEISRITVLGWAPRFGLHASVEALVDGLRPAASGEVDSRRPLP
jgi:nucleoside-diphosphate-sugar epimerase